ncbi:MAG: hypothetical protein WCX93_00505 [Burkholderiaceae bacterium]
MMATNSLHTNVHFIVLSGVSSLGLPLCRRICRADANPVYCTLYAAQPPAQPSHVQVFCLERAWPAAPSASIGVFAGVLAARSAAPPGRRSRERQRQAKAEGKTKGVGTQPPVKPVCTWGWRGTTRLGRRAVGRAKPAPTQTHRRAGYARMRRSFPKEQP